jgi:hypothetical protein
MQLKERALARTRPPHDRPGDTSHPTGSSPGSKRSDYADLASTKPLPGKGARINVGMIRRSA